MLQWALVSVLLILKIHIYLLLSIWQTDLVYGNNIDEERVIYQNSQNYELGIIFVLRRDSFGPKKGMEYLLHFLEYVTENLSITIMMNKRNPTKSENVMTCVYSHIVSMYYSLIRPTFMLGKRDKMCKTSYIVVF